MSCRTKTSWRLLALSVMTLFIAVWCPTASSAQSQPADTTAAEDYARGAQLYNEGRNREALEAFNRAIEKANEPVYICNRAVVLITLEEYDRAIDDLTICRDTYEMPETSRAQIDAQLKALELFETLLRPRAREVAELMANPPEVVPDKIEPPIVVTPLPAPNPSPLRAIGWVSLGLGAGALVGMSAVEAVNREEVARYKADCSGRTALSMEERASCATSQEMLLRQRRLSRALLGAGGLLGVTGGVLLLVSRPGKAEEGARAWHIAPQVTRDGAQVDFSLSF